MDAALYLVEVGHYAAWLAMVVAGIQALAPIAARLLRSASVSIVEDQLLDKPTGGRPVNFHQDYSYWPFSRATRMCTGWLALVAAK